MKFPDELNKLLGQFHADIDLVHDSYQSVIGSAILLLSREEQKAIKQFLTQLLSRNYDVEELERLWRASPADAGPPARQIPYVLGLIRDMINP